MKSYKNFDYNVIDIDEEIEKGGENSVNTTSFPLVPTVSITGPLTNKFQYHKDLEIVKKYGQDFLSFFSSSGCSNLPFFTSRLEPKAVKRIILDQNILVNANEELRLVVRPFNFGCVISINGTAKTLIPPPSTECFLSYRVVTAKFTLKQVGIMQINDGYGTLIDAAVVSPTVDPDFLNANILSIQNSPGKTLIAADGRVGIQANFIGSDLYPAIPTDPKTFTQPKLTMGGPTIGAPIYIPAGSKVANMSGAQVQIKYEDNTRIDLDNHTFTDISKDVTGSTGPLFYDQAIGDALYIRVTPPSINISFKFYLDMVVEGIVKPSYATNMQQIVPPFCFEFERLRYALMNILPCLAICGTNKNTVSGAMLTPVMISPNFSSKPKGSKYSGTTVPPNPPKKQELDNEEDIFDKKNELKNKLEKLPVTLKGKADFFKKNDFTMDDIITFYEVDGEIPEDYQDEVNKIRILFEDPTMKEEDLYIVDDPMDNVCIAMDQISQIKVKVNQPNKNKVLFNADPKFRVKGNAATVNQAELPDYIKDAIDFCLTNVGEKYQQPDTNRLFRDATLPVPELSYQYFPVVDQKTKKVSPALVIVSLDASTENSITIQTVDSEGSKKTVDIYYEPKDFENAEEFLKNLKVIVSFAYKNNMHYSDTPSLTIRMFSPGVIRGSSYMYALMLAMYGAPCGGYYTGSFTFNDEDYVAQKMEKEVIKMKAQSTTLGCPIVVMSGDSEDAAFVNIISGIVPSLEEGKVVTTNNPYIGLIYGCLPFNARLYKETPIKSYSIEIKKYLMSKKAEDYRRYIISFNLHDPEDIKRFLESDDMSWKTFSKSSLPRFSGIAVNKKKYMTANDFYGEHPQFLEDENLWRFKIGDDLFVDRNMFKSHIRQTEDKYKLDFNKNVGRMWRDKMMKVKDVKAQQIKQRLEELKKGYVTSPFNKLTKDFNQAVFRIESNDNKEEIDLWNDVRFLAKPFYRVLEKVSDFVTNHKGSLKKRKKISNSNYVLNTLDLLSIPAWVSMDAPLYEEPAIDFLIKMVDKVGPNAVQGIAYAAGWPYTKAKPNIKLSTLKSLKEFLERTTFPEKERNLSVDKKNSKIFYKNSRLPKYSLMKNVFKKDDKINESDEDENRQIDINDIKLNVDYDSDFN